MAVSNSLTIHVTMSVLSFVDRIIAFYQLFDFYLPIVRTEIQ